MVNAPWREKSLAGSGLADYANREAGSGMGLTWSTELTAALRQGSLFDRSMMNTTAGLLGVLP